MNTRCVLPTLSVKCVVNASLQRELNDLRVRYEDLQGSNELLKKKEKEIEHLNQELEQSKVGTFSIFHSN